MRTATIIARCCARSFSVNHGYHLDIRKAVLEGTDVGLEAARPGNSCSDIAEAFLGVLAKHGIEKANRAGYAIGLSYPPNWGEYTMSLRPGDMSELKPGMIFHFKTGLWMKDCGVEITEIFVVTPSGYEWPGQCGVRIISWGLREFDDDST